MQKDIHYYEKLIQEKRKKTPWREFVKEIASWYPLTLSKVEGSISRFPLTDRIPKIVSKGIFEEQRDSICEKSGEEITGENFLKEFTQLFHSSKIPNIQHYGQSENADFADLVQGSKNIYLSTVVITGCENVLYSLSVKDNCTNVFGGIQVWNESENIYASTGIIRSSQIFYSKFIDTSDNIWFSSNLIGCHECFGCNELVNQSYHINNKPYTQDIYLKYKKELLSKKDIFAEWHMSTQGVPSNNTASTNITGTRIVESTNIENGYYVYHIQNGRNIILGGTTKGNENIYDLLSGGSPYGNNIYGAFSVGGGENLYMSCHLVGSSNIYYSYFLESCSFCLGCIGLKNKSYCILNKQYTKEEWEEKVCEIFASMEEDGTLGEFFPASMNPFYFNDTLAYLIDDSFTKEEVERDGYLWRDEPIRADIPENMKVVKNTELDQFQGFQENKWYINPEILNVVISDEKGNYYRIVKMEYDFLMKHGLPLPTMHWLDRIKMGFR